VLVLTNITMMDRMKLVKNVHTNAQIVPLPDVMNVSKTELPLQKDVHVIMLMGSMKTEMHYAQNVHIDVQLALTEMNVTLVLMTTEMPILTVHVNPVIMMTVLPYVKNVTTDVLHVLMELLVKVVMLMNTELMQVKCVHAKQDITKTLLH